MYAFSTAQFIYNALFAFIIFDQESSSPFFVAIVVAAD